MKHFEKLYVWAALGIIVVLPFLYMDYGSKEYPELNKAICVVRYMSAERQLQRSAFRFTYPEGRPEQFVEWMFSPKKPFLCAGFRRCFPGWPELRCPGIRER